MLWRLILILALVLHPIAGFAGGARSAKPETAGTMVIVDDCCCCSDGVSTGAGGGCPMSSMTPEGCGCLAGQEDPGSPMAPVRTAGLERVVLAPPMTAVEAIQWDDRPKATAVADSTQFLGRSGNARQALLCIWRT